MRAERRDGRCIDVPDVGGACGADGAGSCNPAGACAGPNMALSAALEHSCVVLHDGSTWCWGDNTWGQLGNGNYDFGAAPMRVALAPAIAIGTGYAHSCAIVESGQIHCWGNNEAGQSGWPPTQTSIPVPLPVLGLEGIRFAAVAGGKGHTCALSEDGAVHCWGYNDFGQCGVDPEPDEGGMPTVRTVAPSVVPVLTGVRSFVANNNHACALTMNEIICWGENDKGQLAQDPLVVPYSFAPLAVSLPNDLDAIGIGLGFASSYAVGSDNHLYAWGFNGRGQLGSGSTDPDFTFVPAETMLLDQGGAPVPLENVTEVYRSDGSHQCAKVTDSTALGAGYACWGGNDCGELGYGALPTQGEVFPAARPASALPDRGVQLAFGEDHGCMVVPRDVAVAGDYDDVWCWGRKELVGDGTQPPDDPTELLPPHLRPVRVRWLLPTSK